MGLEEILNALRSKSRDGELSGELKLTGNLIVKKADEE